MRRACCTTLLVALLVGLGVGLASAGGPGSYWWVIKGHDIAGTAAAGINPVFSPEDWIVGTPAVGPKPAAAPARPGAARRTTTPARPPTRPAAPVRPSTPARPTTPAKPPAPAAPAHGAAPATPAVAAVPAAGGIRWMTSLSDGLKQAAADRKPLMVCFYADWNGWCKKLDREVYADPAVKAKAAGLVAVKVNAEQDAVNVGKYSVDGYPTVIFLDPAGKEIHRVVDFRPAQSFLKDLDTALAAAK